MIIGFLGKGGSGKSTVATLLTNAIRESGHHVLAVDADHNMDFSFNLQTSDKGLNYLGAALPDLLKYCNLEAGEKYPEVFFKEVTPTFSYTGHKDSFSNKYVQAVDQRLSMMVAGPHTEKILHGEYCSHSLVTPLKVYLPFLEVGENEYVVVDEKAGRDGAGAGICTGFDVACVVAEPTRHGVKAASQICELLDYYKTPYVLIGNKVMGQEDETYLNEHLPKPPAVCLSVDRQNRDAELSASSREMMSDLLRVCKEMSNNDRKERSTEKFKRNRAYAQAEQQ